MGLLCFLRYYGFGLHPQSNEPIDDGSVQFCKSTLPKTILKRGAFSLTQFWFFSFCVLQMSSMYINSAMKTTQISIPNHLILLNTYALHFRQLIVAHWNVRLLQKRKNRREKCVLAFLLEAINYLSVIENKTVKLSGRRKIKQQPDRNVVQHFIKWVFNSFVARPLSLTLSQQCNPLAFQIWWKTKPHINKPDTRVCISFCLVARSLALSLSLEVSCGLVTRLSRFDANKDK